MNKLKPQVSVSNISRLCIGCEPLGGIDWGEYSHQAVKDAIALSVELGVTSFDTADVYGIGKSEEALSQVLGAKRHELNIVTKNGMRWFPNQWERSLTKVDLSPEWLDASVKGSLRRLRLDRIPVLLLHRWDPEREIGPAIAKLIEWKERGCIDKIGVSNFSVDQIRQCQKYGKIDVVECEYSLLNRSAETELLPFCLNEKIEVLVYGVLAQGLLSGKFGEGARFPVTDRRHRLKAFQGEQYKQNLRIVEALQRIAVSRRTGMVPLALNGVLNHPAVTAAILGVKNRAQVMEATKAVERKLPELKLWEVINNQTNNTLSQAFRP